MSDSSPISPTAHYTGYVWARNQLSHPELETIQGRIMFESLQPAMLVRRLLGQGTLESYLLARHRAIDLLLERAIERHGVRQVIEVAAGLSARGWRFAQRYGELITYVETDLPEMAERKRRALERMGSLSEHHRVAAMDVLSDSGPDSVEAVAAELESAQGLAIVTEGLVGYLPQEATEAMWARFAHTLGGFASGRHICHVHLRDVDAVQVEALSLLLSVFVRGRVRVHYRSAAEVERALLKAGFAQ
ncbi:MAG TPA: class I SAM-dependent methyltransferase, partial [Myxococcaceae bacterium]